MKLNSNNLKLLARGHINPLLLQFTQQSEPDLSKTILISGCNRSGTTWLAELIALLPRTGIIFEPLHIQNVKQAKKAGFLSRNYHFPGTEWPEGEAFLTKVLGGQVLNSWTTSHLPISISEPIERWVVKDIATNPMLGWIIEKFPILPPILLMRHPCAVLASIYKRGWGGSMSMYIKADQAFRDRYPQFEHIFKNIKTVEEVFAARWCIDYFLPLSLRETHPFELVSYEQLVVDGPAVLEPVFQRLGFDMPTKIEAAFNKPSAKVSEDFLADKSKKLSKWRDTLSKDQVSNVLNTLKAFGMDFYTDDPEPDYSRLFSTNPLELP